MTFSGAFLLENLIQFITGVFPRKKKKKFIICCIHLFYRCSYDKFQLFCKDGYVSCYIFLFLEPLLFIPLKPKGLQASELTEDCMIKELFLLAKVIGFDTFKK